MKVNDNKLISIIQSIIQDKNKLMSSFIITTFDLKILISSIDKKNDINGKLNYHYYLLTKHRMRVQRRFIFT